MKKALLLCCTVVLSGNLFSGEPEISSAIKEIWTDQCRKCHGAEGNGNTTMGEKVGAFNFQDPAIQARFTDEEAFKSIKEGKRDSEGKRKMRPAEDVSDEQIRELVRLVRSYQKNTERSGP